jgi:hypothetical protein
MRVRPIAVLVLLAALPAAGCGGGSASGEHPASLVPASAPLYVEAAVRPRGRLHDDGEAALRKLLRTDSPDSKLQALVDRLSRHTGLRWSDLSPWLGARVGVFFTAFAPDSQTGALIAASSDDGKARTALEHAIRRGPGDRPPRVAGREYRGVSFSYDSANDNAAGMVDDYAVFGSLAGFRLVVDTSRGGRALDRSPDFTAVRNGDAHAFAYLRPQELLDALAGLEPAAGPHAGALTVLRQVAAQFGRTIGLSLRAGGAAVGLDVTALGTPAASATTPAAAAMLAGLPGDAWLATGVAGLGPTLTSLIDQAAGPGGDRGPGALLGSFEKRTGLDVRRDLLSWMGDGALYARGSTLSDLGTVLTVHSTDAKRSRAAVARVGRALERLGARTVDTDLRGYDHAIEVHFASLPVTVYVAASGERFSVGLNPQALTDVAEPKDRLADSRTYATASTLLGRGVRPVALLDTPTMVGLLESLGLGFTHQFSVVKPYLDAFGVIAAGARRDGDVVHARVAAALR